MRKFMLIVVLCLAAAGCGESIAHKLETARLSLDSGNPGLALEKADEILEEQPQNLTAWMYKAKAHLRLRQYQASRDALGHLIEQNSEHEEAHRELLTWAMSLMRDTLDQSEFLESVELQKAFTEAKNVGHEQADWLAGRLKDAAGADYARARLILLDADRVQQEVDQQQERLRSANLTPESREPLQEAIDQQQQQVDGMRLRAEQFLNKVLAVQPDHFPAAHVLAARLTERQAWPDVWVMAQRTLLQDDVPNHLARVLVQALLKMPDQHQQQDKRLEACDRLLAAVSDAGRSQPTWKQIAARVHLHRGEVAKALALAEDLFRQAPGDGEARLLLGWCLYKKKEYQRAKSILESLAAQRRDLADVQLIYGLVLVETGDAVLATEALRQATHLDPDNAAARSALIRLLHTDRNAIEAAVEDINKLFADNPSDPQAIRFKLMAEMSTGDTTGIDTLLKHVEALHPLEAEHLGILVDGYMHLKKFDRALEFAQRYRAAKVHDVDANMSYVRVLLARGQTQKARDELIALRQRFGNVVNVELALARLHLDRDEFDEVIGLAEGILKTAPTSIRARMLLAQAYLGLSLTEPALNHVNAVLDTEPRNPAALELAARIYDLIGQPELAKTFIEQIDQSVIDPQENPGLAARVKIWQGDLDGALRICEDAVATGRADALVRIAIADVYRRTSKAAEEEVHLLAYARENPGSYAPFSLLARFYARNNPERGSYQLRQMRSLNEVNARLAEADMFVRLKRYSEAMEALQPGFREALRLGPQVAYMYAQTIASTILARDPADVKEAAAVYQPLVEGGLYAYWARVAQLDLLWNELDDERRFAAVRDLASRTDATEREQIAVVLNRYLLLKKDAEALQLVHEWLKQSPGDVTLLAARATLLANMKHYDEAAAAYQAVINAAPQPGGFYKHLADVHLLRQDFPAAEAAFDKLAEGGTEEQILAKWLKGDMFLRLGLNQDAVETYQELGEVSKQGDPRVQLALGQGLMALRRYEEARAALIAIPSHARQYAAAQVMVARLEQTNPQTMEAAKARLERLMKDGATAAAAVQELLALAGRADDTETLLTWAARASKSNTLPASIRAAWLLVQLNIEARHRNWPAVTATIDQLLAIAPRNATWRMGKVLVLAHLGQQQEAAAEFVGHGNLHTTENGALIAAALGRPADAPQEPFAAFLVWMAQGNFDAAAQAAMRIPNRSSAIFRQDMIDEAMRAGKQSAPTDLYRRTAFAGAAQQLGLPQVADAMCQAILETHPECVIAHAIRMNVMSDADKSRSDAVELLSQSAPSASVNQYFQAVRLATDKPTNLRAAIGLVESVMAREADHPGMAMYLVQLYVRDAQYDKAQSLLRAWYEREGPYRGVFANDLAYLLATRYPDALTEAYAIAEKALSLHPKSAVVFDTLGWIQFKRGNHREAVRLLTQAWSANQRSADWHFHVGKAFESVGNKAWARRHLSAAVQLGGDVKEKAEASLQSLGAGP